MQPLLKKVTPSFPANSKNGQNPLLLKRLVRSSNPLPQKKGGVRGCTLSHNLHLKYDEHHPVQV